MIIENGKPIKIIGFTESSICEEYVLALSKERENVSVITPDQFKSLENKQNYQYIIAFYIEMDLRKEICDLLDSLNLDCVTYIDDNSFIFPNVKIGKGCFIGLQSIISWNCTIGDHCYIAMTTAMGHDVTVGRNTITSPRVDFAGRATIGENCKFLYKCSVLPKVKVCDWVVLSSLSNLTKDAEKPGRYVGHLARFINT